jgi:hypothetical protein
MSLLERIATMDFFASVGFDLPPEAMRIALQRTEEYQQFQAALRTDELTDADLQAFVESLMETFRRGQKFPYEVTLSFLAVGLEGLMSPFAQQFLSDLARVRLSELPLSPRVARTCLQYRSLIPANRQKVFEVTPIHAVSSVMPILETPKSDSVREFRVEE